MGSVKTIFMLVFVGVVFFYLMNAYDLTYTGSVIQGKNANTRDLLQNAESVKKEYNANVQNVPNFVKTLFEDAKVNVEIEMQDGTIMKRQVTMRASSILDVQEGSHAKADFNVWLTEKTSDRILSAEKPTEEFARAVQEKEIAIKANTTYGNTKLFLGRIIVRVQTVI